MEVIDLTGDEDNPTVRIYDPYPSNTFFRAPSVAGDHGPEPPQVQLANRLLTRPRPPAPAPAPAPAKARIPEILAIQSFRPSAAPAFPRRAIPHAIFSYATPELTAVLHRVQTERLNDSPAIGHCFSRPERSPLTSSQRGKRGHDDDDDDIVIIDRPPDADQYHRCKRRKKPKLVLDHSSPEPEATNSEVEYETVHAGYTPKSSNWEAIPQSSVSTEEITLTTTSLSVLQLADTRKGKRDTQKTREERKRNPWALKPVENEYGLWDWLIDFGFGQAVGRHSASSASSRNGRRGNDMRYPSQSTRLDFPRLSLTQEYGGPPGPTTSIVQSHEIIAISARTVNGDADDLQLGDKDVGPDTHNRPGTLHLWMSGEWNGLNAHKRHFVRQEFDEDGEMTKDHSFDKYYDVTDVKFDPKRPTCVVSAGRDGFIRVQDINRKEPLGASRIMEFWPGHDDGRHNTGHYPHTLLFRDPGPSTLAIGSTDGHVYVYNDSIWRDQFDPSICVKMNAAHGKAHNSGEMVWGRGNTLYVSSEPRDSENDHSGYHTAFDVSRPDAFTKFPDVRNSGDSLAIDSTGQNLALITRATAGVHTLRLYDVARQMGARASSKVALESFAFECDTSLHFASEVTSSSFSPDGRLLAIARNDDRLHVYDTRYLGKGPLLQFYHWGELREDAVTGWDNENAKILHYGITCARWVEGWYGHGLGIISGGGDGCVRLWDVMGSDTDPRNGEIIAEASWSIGRISLGDQSKGEKPLVVGDNGGRVYIYDHVSGSLEDAEP